MHRWQTGRDFSNSNTSSRSGNKRKSHIIAVTAVVCALLFVVRVHNNVFARTFACSVAVAADAGAVVDVVVRVRVRAREGRIVIAVAVTAAAATTVVTSTGSIRQEILNVFAWLLFVERRTSFTFQISPVTCCC